MENTPTISTPTLGLTMNATSYLTTVCKWAKFLSILSFICCSLTIISSIGMIAYGSLIAGMNQMGPASMLPFQMIGFIYIAMSVLCLFIAYYMNLFASKTTNAINLNMDSELEAGFKALKSQYTLIGVTTIVMISLMLLAIVGGVIAIIITTAASF
jgi:hypothetical protein